MVFIGFPHRRREVPFRLLVPSLITTIALCSGLASIHFSLKASALRTTLSAEQALDNLRRGLGGELRILDSDPPDVDRLWEKALLCILLAAVFDMLDGRAARLLRAQSPFGAVLDSLSDFLCFGVAPGLLLHQWTLSEMTLWGQKADALGLAAVITYILCAALRLARFTAAARVVRQTPGGPVPPEPKAPGPYAAHFFVGLPSPAAAGAVLIPPMLAVATYPHYPTPDWIVVLFTFLIAGLMVGRQHMFSFKKIRIQRRLVVPLLIFVGLIVVAIFKFPFLTISLLCGAYLLLTPLSIATQQRMAARQRAENPQA